MGAAGDESRSRGPKDPDVAEPAATGAGRFALFVRGDVARECREAPDDGHLPIYWSVAAAARRADFVVRVPGVGEKQSGEAHRRRQAGGLRPYISVGDLRLDPGLVVWPRVHVERRDPEGDDEHEKEAAGVAN